MNIQIKLGLTQSHSFYDLIKEFQQLIITHDPAPRLGLNNAVVEADEYEQGRHQKGQHGHPTVKKGDIRGMIDRESGLCVLEDFEKLKDEHSRREGPPRASEVVPFVL